jgi:hypothetical protein
VTPGPENHREEDDWHEGDGDQMGMMSQWQGTKDNNSRTMRTAAPMTMRKGMAGMAPPMLARDRNCKWQQWEQKGQNNNDQGDDQGDQGDMKWQ